MWRCVEFVSLLIASSWYVYGEWLKFSSHIALLLVNTFDVNQHGPLQDPLHVPSGPITRAMAKKLKEAFSGLDRKSTRLNSSH